MISDRKLDFRCILGVLGENRDFRSKIDRKSTGNQPGIDWKSTENRLKIYRKSTENRPGIDRKSTENRSEIDRKSTENRPKINRKSTGNRPEIDRKSTGNRLNIRLLDRKSTGNRPKIRTLQGPLASDLVASVGVGVWADRQNPKIGTWLACADSAHRTAELLGLLLPTLAVHGAVDRSPRPSRRRAAVARVCRQKEHPRGPQTRRFPFWGRGRAAPATVEVSFAVFPCLWGAHTTAA